MKLFAATFMAFLFLIQGMSINVDLCGKMEHFTDFLAHYQIHKKQGGDTFLEYIGEEISSYAGLEDSHKDDSHRHDTSDHEPHKCCHASVFVSPSSVAALDSIFVIQQSPPIHYSFLFNSRFLESLFQPPRV